MCLFTLVTAQKKYSSDKKQAAARRLKRAKNKNQ
jgi:hypothetical protein